MPTTAVVAAMTAVAVATAAACLGKKYFLFILKYMCVPMCVSESWVIFFIIIK